MDFEILFTIYIYFLGEIQFALCNGFLRDAEQGFLGGAGHRERSVLGALRLQKLRAHGFCQLWICMLFLLSVFFSFSCCCVVIVIIVFFYFYDKCI